MLDPAECSLERGDELSVIRHSSGSWFSISHKGKDFSGRAVVVDNGKVFFEFTQSYEHEFRNVKWHLTTWAQEIKKVTDMSDLWAEMRRSRELISEIQRADSGNTPFTEDEQRQISAQLQAIKDQLTEHSELTSERLERVEETLDEVVEASKRMGRKDWLIYFLGSITSLIITATVVAGVGEHILTMVIHGIAHLFTGGIEPPQIQPQPIA